MISRWLLLFLAATVSCSAASAQDALPEPRKIQTPASVYSLALSGDGKTLVTLDQTQSVRVWDVAKGTHEVLHLFAAIRPIIRTDALALRSDGKRLAALDIGVVHIFDVPAKKKMGTLPGNSAVFSPDGKWLAVSRGSEAEIYDADTLKSVHRFYAYQVKIDQVAFRPPLKKDDASLTLATLGNAAPKAQLWDVTGKNREMFLHARTSYPQLGRHMAFRSDGNVLACIDGSNDVLLWDFSGDMPAADLLRKGVIVGLAFRPNSNHLAVAHSTIEIWDVGTQKRVAQTGQTGIAVGVWLTMAFSADGNTLVASTLSRSISVWDLSKLPASPMSPIAKNPAGNMPEVKETYQAYIENLLHGEDKAELPEFVLETYAKTYLTDGPVISIGGKSNVDPKTMKEITVQKRVAPVTMDMRLMKDKQPAELKQFRLGDLVEVSYSSRRFPSTEIRVVEHDAARTRRQEAFVEAMKGVEAEQPRPLKLPPQFTLPPRLIDNELDVLRRPVGNAKNKAAEDKAAAVIFKLVEEKPGDRQSFNFLRELMSMGSPEVHKKAAELMVKHQIKNESMGLFLFSMQTRAKAPDELFERLLEQKEVSDYRAGACMLLANRWYYRAKLSQDKTSKKVADKDAVAAAIKYHELLKKEFAQETMTDMQRLVTAFPPRKPAGVMADERLAEIRGVWAGLPKVVLAGEPAPPLVGIDANGKEIKLSDFKGKIVVLRTLESSVFFAPKVVVPPPIKKKGAAAPPGRFDIERSLQERFKDKIVCVLVTWDVGGKGRMNEFLDKERIDWPVIRLSGSTEDYSRKMMKEWYTRSSERIFIIDPRGNVRLRDYTFPREIGETVEGLLTETK